MSSQSMFPALFCVLPWLAPGLALGVAAGVALAAAGATLRLVVPPPDSATIRPKVRPSAIGTATGTTSRADGLRRRGRALRRAVPGVFPLQVRMWVHLRTH